MSISFSPETVTIPMKLSAEYNVNANVGCLNELVTGTIRSVDDASLPRDLISIRNYLFQNDIYLTSVNLTNIVTVGIESFSGCAITELNMPKLESAGLKAFAFNPFENLVFPALTNVGIDMFYGCDDLISIDLPVATVINRRSFYNCTNLETLILRADTIVSLEGELQFYGTKISDLIGHIYVPTELVDTYKVTYPWSTYTSLITSIEELEDETV